MGYQRHTAAAFSCFLVLAALACGGSKKEECAALEKAIDEAGDASIALFIGTSSAATTYSEVAESAGKIEAATAKLAAMDLKTQELKDMRDKRKKALDELAAAQRAVKGNADDGISEDEAKKLNDANAADLSPAMDVAGDLAVFCK